MFCKISGLGLSGGSCPCEAMRVLHGEHVLQDLQPPVGAVMHCINWGMYCRICSHLLTR